MKKLYYPLYGVLIIPSTIISGVILTFVLNAVTIALMLAMEPLASALDFKIEYMDYLNNWPEEYIAIVSYITAFIMCTGLLMNKAHKKSQKEN